MHAQEKKVNDGFSLHCVLQASCDCTEDCSCKCSKCSKFKVNQQESQDTDRKMDGKDSFIYISYISEIS